MTPGSRGLIYCSEGRFFTMPFEVVSQPKSPDDIISNVWPGCWGLPFKISPLGSPDQRISLSSAKLQFTFLNHGGNPTHALKGMNGLTQFGINQISSDDWNIVLSKLGFMNN
jgi:hypothetical protein